MIGGRGCITKDKAHHAERERASGYISRRRSQRARSSENASASEPAGAALPALARREEGSLTSTRSEHAHAPSAPAVLGLTALALRAAAAGPPTLHPVSLGTTHLAKRSTARASNVRARRRRANTVQAAATCKQSCKQRCKLARRPPAVCTPACKRCLHAAFALLQMDLHALCTALSVQTHDLARRAAGRARCLHGFRPACVQAHRANPCKGPR